MSSVKQTTAVRTTDRQGAFVRAESVFRNWVTRDGSPGPTGISGFKAESGRYHLIVALNCPWAHRTLIFHRLKRLDDIVSLGIVHPQRTAQGWAFLPFPGSNTDEVLGAQLIREYYHLAEPDYNGRYTVPVLWDKQQQTIVNNESADIIRMFNSAFDELSGASVDYYPEPLRPGIDQINAFIYEKLNNGVYRAGFTQSQSAYEAAYVDVFHALDALETRLQRRRYLLGERITEADWRLFPTLIRFDAVYYGLFKCNRQRLMDYPALWGYTRDLYQHPGIATTVNLHHIKQGYWRKSERNPTGIVPLGPEPALESPHGRDLL